MEPVANTTTTYSTSNLNIYHKQPTKGSINKDMKKIGVAFHRNLIEWLRA